MNSRPTRIEKQRRMLDKAHEIRRFELDLYWKRTTYFSVFTTLLFTGYFTASDDMWSPIALLLIAIFGFAFVVIWALANHSGVFWYERWEKYVDQYEIKLGEELHAEKPCPCEKPTSLRVLNNCIVGLAALMWMCVLIYSVYDICKCKI